MNPGQMQIDFPTSLFLDTTYYVTVKAIDYAGNYSPPQQQSFTTWNGGTWAQVNNAGSPSARTNNAKAVWTGTEFVVWGGYGNSGALNTGALYNPVTEVWTSVAVSGAPTARYDHKMHFDGAKLWVMGGDKNTAHSLNLPANSSWTSATPLPGLSSPYYSSYAGDFVLSDGLFHIWSPNINTPSYYSCLSADCNSWSYVLGSVLGNPSDSPGAREHHVTVAMGDEETLFIWGGRNSSWGAALNTGACLNHVSETWHQVSHDTNTPSPRLNPAAVVIPDENKVIVWGGSASFDNGSVLSDGAIYDVANSEWMPMSPPPPGFQARANFAYAWIENRFAVWGGHNQSGVYYDNGALYNPETDTWAPMFTPPLLARRYPAFGAQSNDGFDEKFFIWGGDAHSTFYNDGVLYSPGINP